MLLWVCRFGGEAVRTVGSHLVNTCPPPKDTPSPFTSWTGCSCLRRTKAPCPGGGSVCPHGVAPLCPGPCLSPSSALPPALPGAEAMASKPEKRVASSVFITLAPPRRDEAVAEEVRRAACEARPGRPWESPAPTKAPGAGSAGRRSPWTPSGRAAATVPAVPHQLSNGGKRVRTGGSQRQH